MDLLPIQTNMFTFAPNLTSNCPLTCVPPFQIMEKALKKLSLSCGLSSLLANHSFSHRLGLFLSSYRIIPSTSTGKTPNEVLLAFRPRTYLSAINPKFIRQLCQFTPPFREDDKIFVRLANFPIFEAIIVRQISATRYLVSVEGVLKKYI